MMQGNLNADGALQISDSIAYGLRAGLPEFVPILKQMLEAELVRFRSCGAYGLTSVLKGMAALEAARLLGRPGNLVRLLGVCGAAAMDAIPAMRSWLRFAYAASMCGYKGVPRAAAEAIVEVAGTTKALSGPSYFVWCLAGRARRRAAQGRRLVKGKG
jgi:hypothetical protein